MKLKRSSSQEDDYIPHKHALAAKYRYESGRKIGHAFEEKRSKGQNFMADSP